ncbi:hypothetical protein FOH10_00450 [Nocardia otitidiscaviarum]|uniref:Uncharacterized protein n=1 Tax=Nocardia otitidiscaviarum TaxID=1823 RepID=A0A516NEV3_9NOCA|nr:hypothetical protein [Nocardia otitidiscaviarum]MCP9622690.1 hypothetical protein [Nocardia otitidiscaviarum]QDP77432.1 hypothetical protein FOH10_00450 [Nocardia otitidiscaviarum]
MGELRTKNQQTLQGHIDTIQSKQPELGGLEKQISDAFDNAQDWLSSGGAVIGTILIPIPGIGTAVGGSAGMYLQGHKEECIKAVRFALEGDADKNIPGLLDFLAAIQLPVKLLEIATDWRNIKNHVKNGYDEQSDADISTWWQSPGADAYESTRQDHENAFLAVMEICEATAGKLEDIGTDLIDYYADLATNVVDLVATISTNIASMAGPGLAAAAGEIVDSIWAIARAIVSAITGALKVNTRIQINLGAIQSNLNAVGLKNGKWPDASVGDYRDATVADGNANWSVKTDREYSD